MSVVGTFRSTEYVREPQLPEEFTDDDGASLVIWLPVGHCIRQ
jgi:hypothetical protein